jgi:hypothetical protein
MFTTAGLERLLVSAAIFLSLIASWRHPSAFFTVSDLVFCLSLRGAAPARACRPRIVCGVTRAEHRRFR